MSGDGFQTDTSINEQVPPSDENCVLLTQLQATYARS